jgi:hypothetical protein
MWDVRLGSLLHYSSIDIPCSIFPACGRGVARKDAKIRKDAKAGKAALGYILHLRHQRPISAICDQKKNPATRAGFNDVKVPG